MGDGVLKLKDSISFDFVGVFMELADLKSEEYTTILEENDFDWEDPIVLDLVECGDGGEKSRVWVLGGCEVTKVVEGFDFGGKSCGGEVDSGETARMHCSCGFNNACAPLAPDPTWWNRVPLEIVSLPTRGYCPCLWVLVDHRSDSL